MDLTRLVYRRLSFDPKSKCEQHFTSDQERRPIATECTPTQLEFHALGCRDVVGCFDGGRINWDGGGFLLREVDHRIGLLDRVAACFTDHRNPNSIEHSVSSLVAQRVYGLALGYEDLNNHDILRAESALALLVGKRDLTGAPRERAQDESPPTMERHQ